MVFSSKKEYNNREYSQICVEQKKKRQNKRKILSDPTYMRFENMKTELR